MIIVIATVRLHPGKAQAYEAACARLMADLRASNPAVVFYHAGLSRDEPDTYRVVEAYTDEAAMAEHMRSRFVTQSMAELGHCIAEIDVRKHDVVA